jgi:F0F1-type ATP synthase membrane subunit b/b'
MKTTWKTFEETIKTRQKQVYQGLTRNRKVQRNSNLAQVGTDYT